MWTFIHESPILCWPSRCRSNTITTWTILGNYALTLGQSHEGRAVRPRVVGATSPHPYKPLGFWAGPLPHHQETFCLSTKSWGQVDIFPLEHHNFLVWCLMLTSNHSIIIYASRRCRWIPHLPHSGRYWGSYACSNLGSPRSHCCNRSCLGTTPHSNCRIS